MDIVLRHFNTIDSTNTWARQNAQSLDRDKITLVTADEQTAGRGRFKHRWESPADQNIYATFCFFIDEINTNVGNIPQVMAITACQALDDLGFHVQLKWPNDLLISSKKVGGILCEIASIQDSKCVILGIGINVNMSKEDLERIDRPATSLKIESGVQQDIKKVLEILKNHFIKNLELFLKSGFLPFLDIYRKRLMHHSGSKMRFHDNRFIWQGEFHSIKDDGSLNLQLESGIIKNFVAGEIL